MAAWLAMGRDRSVVSHESALQLLDLSDVSPAVIHLTVPRTVRHLPHLPGVRVHTSTRVPENGDIVQRRGLYVTAPARSILDAAQDGTAPEQVEMAIRQAIDRGWATPSGLQDRARRNDERVRDLIDQALQRLHAYISADGFEVSRRCRTPRNGVSAHGGHVG